MFLLLFSSGISIILVYFQSQLEELRTKRDELKSEKDDLEGEIHAMFPTIQLKIDVFLQQRRKKQRLLRKKPKTNTERPGKVRLLAVLFGRVPYKFVITTIIA
jgi:hypothetical protein